MLETSGGVKIEIKRTRRRKIDPDALKKAVEEKPDAYLHELSKMFDCSPSSVYRRLVGLGFTYKKDLYLLGKIRRGKGGISVVGERC